MKFEALKTALIRQPKRKWFSAESMDAEDWYGPYDTIGEAALEMVSNDLNSPIFVAQASRIPKAERYSENEWEIDGPTIIEIKIHQKGPR